MEADVRRVGTAATLYSLGYAGLTVLLAVAIGYVAPVSSGLLLLCLVGLGMLSLLLVLLGSSGSAARGLGGHEDGGILTSPVESITFYGESMPTDVLLLFYGAGLLTLSFLGLVLVG